MVKYCDLAICDSVNTRKIKNIGWKPQYSVKDGLKRTYAFIAFPGGTGTLEEIAEVMSKVSLKHLDAPCILYDLDGYYTGLRMLLSHMIETGLSSEERQEGIYFAKDLAEIKAILNR